MKKAFLYSLKHSFPIFISFIPVGLAYGMLMQSAGYNFMWTGACSIFVLAGSLQYLMVSFFTDGVSLAMVAVMALLLNSRHVFYGLPFIEKFKSFGPWKYFLIYSLADESFSLHCSHDFGEDVDEKQAYIFTAALVVAYWVALSVLGALLGSIISIPTAGIDFALTALFIVILLEQLKGADTVLPAVIAFASSVACIAVLGADKLILPSLIVTVLALMLLRGKIQAKMVKEAQA